MMKTRIQVVNHLIAAMTKIVLAKVMSLQKKVSLKRRMPNKMRKIVQNRTSRHCYRRFRT